MAGWCWFRFGMVLLIVTARTAQRRVWARHGGTFGRFLEYKVDSEAMMS